MSNATAAPLPASAEAFATLCAGSKTAPFLLVVTDDDERAHLKWCVDHRAVLMAVCAAVFPEPIDKLLPEHHEEAMGITTTLLIDGTMRFEGDPLLHLFSCASGAWAASERLAVEPIKPWSVAVRNVVDLMTLGGCAPSEDQEEKLSAALAAIWPRT
jgi:hypothetical protein